MKEKDSDVVALFGQFSNDTSLHGIKHITDGSKGIRRVFWVSALIAMLALLVFIVVNQVIKFSCYPFYTVTTLQQTHQLPFPSVTICNSNMFRRSFFNNDTVTEMAVRTLYDKNPMRQNFDVQFSDPNVTSKNTDCDPRPFYKNSAHQLKNMFLYCSWKTEEVNCSQYLTTTLTNHGACYTWNSQQFIDKEGRLEASTPGEEGGLRLMIDIEEHENFYGVSSATGVKVLVHEPHVFPNMLNKGFLAAPGTKVSAAASLCKVKCLPPPYTAMGKEPCLDTHAADYKHKLKFFKTYDMAACYMECASNYAIKKCGCQEGFDNASDVFYCTLRQMIQCYKPAKAEHLRNVTLIEGCSCLRQCRWDQYDVTVSSGGYPQEHYIEQYTRTKNVSREYILKNYLELTVFYGQLVFTEIEQVPTYTSVDIVANLGGQLGIFLGASFLTLTEVMEYVIGALCVLCNRRKKTVVQAWTTENTDKGKSAETTKT